jgi:hypothetical protein
MELPRGEAGQPTPVSGAWYLGILRGGTALQAGARLIKRLTSTTEELHKLNYGIGLPVRRALFDAPNSLEAIPPLPYRKRFRQIARIQSSPLKSSDRDFDVNVIRSVCPFYRSRIRHYSQVSPLLMGLMTSAARAALASRFRAWVVERNEPFPTALAAEIEGLVKRAAERYRQIVPY